MRPELISSSSSTSTASCPYRLEKRAHPISLNPSTLFDYQSSNLWIKCRKSEIDFTTSIQYVKRKLKRSLLDFQFNHGEDWHNLNFDTAILNSNYVLYIHSNLINVLQNTNLTSNTLCNT